MDIVVTQLKGSIRMQSVALTHVGFVRQNNEDAYFMAPLQGWSGAQLLLVADGVGGKDYGELASSITVDTLLNLNDSGKLAAAKEPAMADLVLSMAALRAHKAIMAHAQAHPECRGMACTLTLVLATPGECVLIQVGDSRCYLYSDKLIQQSEDQTIAALLAQHGRITNEEAAIHPDRNVLHQALGVEAVNEPLQPVVSRFKWTPGDIVLLCSDGLTDMVNHEVIANTLAQSVNLELKAEQLVQLALDGGGRDNVTLILAKLEDTM